MNRDKNIDGDNERSYRIKYMYSLYKKKCRKTLRKNVEKLWQK